MDAALLVDACRALDAQNTRIQTVLTTRSGQTVIKPPCKVVASTAGRVMLMSRL